ncbi:MAG: S-layer homology domain-containing protein [Firmicutes bacterium]|nr:S-layer homology domain-containing protein [Bacillota bacterium]
MRKVISLLLALVLCIGLAVPVAAADNKQVFSDVKESDWYYPYVMELYERGGVNGMGDGTFNPNGTVTAAEFMAIAARLVTPQYINMSSASEGWAFPYYDALVKAKIVSPYQYKRSMNTYIDMSNYLEYPGLNRKMIRNMMAEMLYDMADYRNEDMSILPNIENNIPDSGKCGKEALWAYSAGILTGKTGGYFEPSGYMTRAEMCTVFCRLMNYVAREEVVVKDITELIKTKGEYVVMTGTNKGLLKPAFSRQKELEALSMIKLGEDKKGVYVTFTAPELPEAIAEDFTYTLSSIVYDSNGYYFADDVRFENMKPGETRTGYFKLWWKDGYAKSKQIKEISLAVWLPNVDGNKMFIRKIYNTDKAIAYAQYDDGYSDNVAFDSTAIWAGIGK